MNVKQIGIGRKFATYEELKENNVVAQGWQELGDMSYLRTVDSPWNYFSCFRESQKGWTNTFNHFFAGAKFKPGDIVLAYEGTRLLGICEIPEEHLYFYDDRLKEYRNTLFPVKWVNWNQFCDVDSLSKCGGQGVSGVEKCGKEKVLEFIKDNWTNYKQENELSPFPAECLEMYEQRKEQLQTRIDESKKQIERRMELHQITNYVILLEQSKNLILSGAPGTGKTYLAKLIAKAIIGKESLENSNSQMVQFHPSLDYTDFVEGLRPIQNDDNTIGFKRQDGIFKAFCAKAANDKDNRYVFIIDEINRGEISKIFGELFYSIDPNYRGVKGKVQTQYQNLIEANDTFSDGFFVPDNVYVIGTMNDIDRSVESMDFAMRRRFTFKEVSAEERVGMLDELLTELDKNHINEAKGKLVNLNVAISDIQLLGKSFNIGPAYFGHLKHLLNDSKEPDYNALWELHLAPLLQEYLRSLPNANDLFEKLEKAYNEQPS